MSSKVILTAAICICLAISAYSHVSRKPRRMPKFGFPPGKIRLPVRSMKFPRFQPLMPFGSVAKPRPGRFIPRLVPKPFMFHKKGPIHQHMFNKMRKMSKFSKTQPLSILPRFGKSHRGSFQDRSTWRGDNSQDRSTWRGDNSQDRSTWRSDNSQDRSTWRADNSRVFIPRTPMFRPQHGFGKQPFGKPTMTSQPQGRNGAISGTPISGPISGGWNGGYGGRPVQTYGNISPNPGHAFHSVNQERGPSIGQQPVHDMNVGFQGGQLRHSFRDFNDADMFDDKFDDKFDRETEDFRGNNVRDIDDSFRDSLEVPNIFGAHSGPNQNTNTDFVQNSKHLREDYNRLSMQPTSAGVLGSDSDKFDDMQKLSVASANAGFNPFNIPSGFLDRQTGVNSGGGIGVLQTLADRKDDMFDDAGEGKHVPFNVNFNTMNPVTNTKDSFSGTNPAFPSQQMRKEFDDQKIEPNSIRFPGVTHQSAHFETTFRRGDDIKDVNSGFLGQNMAGSSQINGLEFHGNNHPNMMTGQQFQNTEREGDLHNDHPTHIQVLPFNPHSDERNGDVKDSPMEDLGDGTLDMYGIDPRTIDNSMIQGQFNMPSSFPAGSLPGSSQFPMHQPAQLPPSHNINNPAPFPTSPSNDPSNGPFATHSNDPSNRPFATPFNEPSNGPFASPFNEPSNVPFATPFNEPSNGPFATPFNDPSNGPFATSFNEPSNVPFATPFNEPSNGPFATPFNEASNGPFATPFNEPSNGPFATPFNEASNGPFATPFNDQSKGPFAPASSQNPSESMFAPSAPMSPGQQFQVDLPQAMLPGQQFQADLPDSQVFPDIPMNSDVFYNIFNQPSSQSVDNAANGPLQQDMSDLSILSQIPSVDDLTKFGNEIF